VRSEHSGEDGSQVFEGMEENKSVENSKSCGWEKKELGAGRIGAILVVAVAVQVGLAQPKAARARETVTSFYEAYLQALAQNRDPFTQDKAFVKRYVAASLIAEIDKQIKSPDGLEADYFLQAQDFLDEWKGHISVAEAAGAVKAGVAVTVVTLGTKASSEYRLKVRLKKETGGWKISHVQRLSAI
jgi:ABC-type transporter MlaC component